MSTRAVTVRSVGVPVLALAALLPGAASTSALACDPAQEAAVAADAGNIDARDALARSCLRAGRPEVALGHYDLLLGRDPSNADWLLGKSQALVALDRPREALPLLERARAIAPAYEDVWRLEAAALEAAGEHSRADDLVVDAERAFPGSAWPTERRRALAEERLLERGTRLSLDASYEELSDGLPAWRGASVAVDRRLGGARHALAGLNFEERFERRDEQLFLGFVDSIDDVWTYAVAGETAADAELLPEWGLLFEAGRALPGGRGLALRARHASYASADVDSLAATVEQYLSRFRVSYSLNAAKTSGIDDPSFSHVLRLAHDYGRDSYVGLAVGYGEESESIAPSVVLVTDVRSVSLHGIHWRSAAWGIAWEAGWTEQGDLYDRFRVRLGLEHRF